MIISYLFCHDESLPGRKGALEAEVQTLSSTYCNEPPLIPQRMVSISPIIVEVKVVLHQGNTLPNKLDASWLRRCSRPSNIHHFHVQLTVPFLIGCGEINYCWPCDLPVRLRTVPLIPLYLRATSKQRTQSILSAFYISGSIHHSASEAHPNNPSYHCTKFLTNYFSTIGFSSSWLNRFTRSKFAIWCTAGALDTRPR